MSKQNKEKEKGKNDHLIDGSIMLGIGVVFMLILVGVFGNVGKIITDFFVGVFGYAVYAYFLALIIIGVLTMCKVKRPKMSNIRLVSLLLFFAMIISLLHSVSSSQYAGDGYGQYLINCYEQHNTAGGILAGIFLYPLMLVQYLGIIISSIFALGFSAVFVFYDAWVRDYKFAKKGIPTGDMVDFNSAESDGTYEVVGTSLNVDNDSDSKKRSNKDNYIPLDELGESRESVDFGMFDETEKEEIDDEQTDQENALKGFFARFRDKKQTETASVEEDPFNKAYNILYNNDKVDKDKPKEQKPIIENKEEFESYTNNYRMNKIKKNLGINEKNATESNSSIFDFKLSSEPEKIDNSDDKNAFDTTSNIQNNIEQDYFSVDEIVVNKNDLSNVEDKKTSVEPISKTFDTAFDTPKENLHNESNMNLANNSFAQNKNIDNIFNDSARNDNFANNQTINNQSSDFNDWSSVFNSRENSKIEDMPVEDKTASHNEINDFHELLKRKKEEREQREKEFMEKRHTIDFDNNVIPTIEDEIKRKERSDKGGSHQMGRGVNFGLNTNPAITSIAPELSAINNESNGKKGKVRVKLAPYKYPPIELLKEYDSRPPREENFDDKIQILESTLSEFGIDAKVNNVVSGPTFTRLELTMPRGVSVNKVASYVNDIAMCLEVKSVRCQIPIPGKNAFGVEIPNKERGTVGLKSVIQSDAFQNPKQKISFALGQDCDGDNYVADLTTMPHLLIAGATGAGKSVCLNSLIVSLLYKYTPEELRLLLVDPKQVELNMYNRIPHLLIPEAISDKDKALNLLDWAIEEMEMRYTMFKDKRVQKISDYNAQIDPKKEDKLPYIVIIIDEVGDFMVTIKKELEDRIVRLTQKARAAGIHLILATQRPSVDVITGIIKANLPSRIAFAVPSYTDSKTIIDQGGAEKLLRNGDMIFADSTSPEAVRIQGTFISGGEVNAVCDYVRDHNEAYFDKDIEEFIMNTNTSGGANPAQTTFGESSGEQDELFVRALYNVVSTGSVSISKLQRKFGIGFPRAARLVDTMEELGYIGVAKDNNKQREILIDMPTLLAKYGDVNLE